MGGTTGAGGAVFPFLSETEDLVGFIGFGGGSFFGVAAFLGAERDVDLAGGSGCLTLLFEVVLGGAALAATLACLALVLAGISLKILLF